MYYIFYKTNDVFAAEEILQNIGVSVEVVPTPVQDKAYCGVCVRIKDADSMMANNALANMEYQCIN